jgi:hypothetical protein
VLVLLIAPAFAVFLSVFKWEARKGWKDLVRGFCDAFKPTDNVVLWILTKPFLDSGEVRCGCFQLCSLPHPTVSGALRAPD